MSSDESSWYVKASFGAEWGPMSAETFLRMADDGSFASDDVARCGVDDAWQPVIAVLETMRSGAPPAFANELEEVSAEPPDEIASEVMPEPSDVADRPVIKPARRTSLPGWSTYWAPGTSDAATTPLQRQFALTTESSANAVDTLATPAVAPDDDEPTSTNDTFVEAEYASQESRDLDSDGRFTELNEWKRERKVRLDRLLKIVADREAAVAREAEAAKLAAAVTCPEANTPEQDPLVEIAANGNTSVPDVAEPQLPQRTAPHQRQETWEETLARWRRSVPDWRFALPLLLLPWLIWSIWPVSNGSIAKNYRSMYSELRRLRDLPLDKSSMEEFVSRSHGELDELLPKLKRRATSQDSDTQLLYWIGRDCLKPMLKSPRMRNTKHEDMLKKLLAQWDRTHHIEPVSETPETSDSGAESLPVSPSAKPLGFGKSSEPVEPVEAELPPPSAKTKSKPQPVEDDGKN